MDDSFRFKRFDVRHGRSSLKVGTDAVVLGAAMTLKPTDKRLLDIGTGCGVIALMAAQRLDGSDIKITGIDIDAASVSEAQENFAASPWRGRLEASCVPLAEYAPEAPLDVIFSNPPFFENSLKNPDGRRLMARHTDGLSYRDICAFAAGNLTAEGRLSLILPYDSAEALRRSAASFGLHPFRLLTVRTTPSKAPKRLLAEFSRDRGPVLEDSLVLQDGSGRSPQYSELTKDFYL